MGIVERIKSKAEDKGYTLASLERELGFGNGTMRKWNTNSPSCDKAISVANLLNLSLDYIILGENCESQIPSTDKLLLDTFHSLNDLEKGRVIGFAEGLIANRNADQEKRLSNSQSSKNNIA